MVNKALEMNIVMLNNVDKYLVVLKIALSGPRINFFSKYRLRIDRIVGNTTLILLKKFVLSYETIIDVQH